MKNLILVLVVALMSSFVHAGGGTSEVKIKTTAVCGMCKKTIERNLTLAPGVKKAELNLDDKVVTISYNPKKTNVEALKKNINLSGYDADDQTKDLSAHAKLPACCKEGCNAAH